MKNPFKRIDRDFRTNGNAVGLATESLWLNPAARASLDNEQMPLFAKEI